MTGAKQRFKHIPELDGLRGIAVLLVFFHHAIYTSIHADAWGRGMQALSGVCKYGMYGVDIFFVLSGFLITSLLLDDREKPYFYQNFYWKRVLRILPLFALTLLLVAIVQPDARKYVLLSVFFVANYANVFHVSPYLGPFWTLAIEEQFYLVWPQMSRKLSAQRLRSVALGVFAATSIFRLLASKSAHHNFSQSQYRFDGLALGAALACDVFLRRMQHMRGPEGAAAAAAWWSGMRRFVLLPAVVLGIAGLTGRSTWLLGGDTSESLIISSIVLATAAVIAYAIAHPGAGLLAILRSRVFAFFGAISYAFYLAHLYLLRVYDHFKGEIADEDVRALAVRAALVFGVTVLLCLVARKVVEEPAHRLRRFVLRSPEEARQAQAVS